MENYIELVSVPAIATIVYTLISVAKKALGDNKVFARFIPLISLALGAICGLVAFYAVPASIIADNVFVAMMMGAASGLSATGTNQLIKQIKTKPTQSVSNETSTSVSVGTIVGDAVIHTNGKEELITKIVNEAVAEATSNSETVVGAESPAVSEEVEPPDSDEQGTIAEGLPLIAE